MEYLGVDAVQPDLKLLEQFVVSDLQDVFRRVIQSISIQYQYKKSLLDNLFYFCFFHHKGWVVRFKSCIFDICFNTSLGLTLWRVHIQSAFPSSIQMRSRRSLTGSPMVKELPLSGWWTTSWPPTPSVKDWPTTWRTWPTKLPLKMIFGGIWLIKHTRTELWVWTWMSKLSWTRGLCRWDSLSSPSEETIKTIQPSSLRKDFLLERK